MKKKVTIAKKNVSIKKVLHVREKALIRARTARAKALRSIRNLNTLAQDSCLNVDKRELFKARVNSMEKFVDEFEQCQQNILTALVNLDRTVEFETVDALVSDEMEELTGNIKMVNDNQQATSTTTNTPIKMAQLSQTENLSKIVDLPKFDGKIAEWRSFRDTFQSHVHKHLFISDIDRFNYLISCLSGPPLAIVKAIPLSADNYNVAWSTLHKCFENRLLATEHVDKLLNFPTIEKESAASLSSFVNTFRENVAVIKTLGIEDLADFLLFHIGARVLDTKTRRLLEDSLPLSKIPNLDMLLNFVAVRCEFLEHVNSNSNEKSEPLKENSVVKVKGDLSTKSFVVATTSQNPPKCLFCQNDHQLHYCFSFKKKSVAIRRKFAAINRLCFRCLKSGHSTNSCYLKLTCKMCRSNHNTLLHFETEQSTSIEVKNSSYKQTTKERSINVIDIALNSFSTTSADTTVLL